MIIKSIQFLFNSKPKLKISVWNDIKLLGERVFHEMIMCSQNLFNGMKGCDHDENNCIKYRENN